MVPSTFDPCLFLTQNPKVFGLVGLQTDDTLFVGNEAFATLEENGLRKAGIQAKPIEIPSFQKPLLFNGEKIFDHGNSISLTPKNQGDKLKLFNRRNPFKQNYIEQRARGAYIASVCQPEAAFDLSVATQNQDPTD